MRENSARLRASTLWVPGVLVVILGASIHSHVASLRGQGRFVAGNAVACTLPVDLSDHTNQDVQFVAPISREFTLGLVLRVAAPADQGPGSREADSFPDNPIAQSLKTSAFEVSWRLSGTGQSDLRGSITEKDLRAKIQTDHLRYVFSKHQVPLKAGRSYNLVTEVVGPSAAMNSFEPAFVVQTSSPLKAHPLARWRLKDTALIVFLGVCLISLGLSKRYSDRKKHRLRRQPQSVAQPPATGEDEAAELRPRA